ncbi:MAG: hypothetical protein ACYDH3_07935 [Candidatus Aminicenantales bacterium]
MNLLKKLSLIILTVMAIGITAFAQTATPPPQTFGTTIYFDYTTFVTTDGYLTSNALTNKFHFRRAYFTYENKINDSLKFRFRFDADNTANLTSVDFVKQKTKMDDKLRPFVKHIYLEWSPDFLSSKINVGMIETLAFKLAEDRWGYRSVAKTILDGYKDITGVDVKATSADLGVSWKGTLLRQLRFGLAVHNGSAYSHAETDKYKKFSGYLQFVPTAGLSLVGYVDYEKQTDSQKAMTTKVDVLFDMVQNLNVSFEWFSYDNDTFVNADNTGYKASGWSVFGTYKLNPDKLALFARYDRYEPNTTVANNEIGLIIAGFDWTPFHSSWKLQPNVWIYDYADGRKGDAVFNLTFFLSF